MITDLPEQLIEQAEGMVSEALNEADLRRAVSSAYYAVFHLLIREAAGNWKNTADHARLARVPDHKPMKDASARMIKKIESLKPMDIGENTNLLSFVAQTFIDLQQARQKADYDISDPFGSLDAEMHVSRARLAFIAWDRIKGEPLAQDYLYTLLFKER